MGWSPLPFKGLSQAGVLLVVLVGLHAPASVGVAQSVGAAPHAASDPAAATAPRIESLGPVQAAASTARLLTGGLIGGGTGLLVGGLAGAVIGSNRCTDPGNPDSCSGLEGLVIGGIMGEAVGIPLGVHLANRRRGRLGTSLAASVALAAAGAGAVVWSDSREVALGVAAAVPAAQFAASILLERRTGRRN
jgi:hypothetical protein